MDREAIRLLWEGVYRVANGEAIGSTTDEMLAWMAASAGALVGIASTEGPHAFATVIDVARDVVTEEAHAGALVQILFDAPRVIAVRDIVRTGQGREAADAARRLAEAGGPLIGLDGVVTANGIVRAGGQVCPLVLDALLRHALGRPDLLERAVPDKVERLVLLDLSSDGEAPGPERLRAVQ